MAVRATCRWRGSEHQRGQQWRPQGRAVAMRLCDQGFAVAQQPPWAHEQCSNQSEGKEGNFQHAQIVRGVSGCAPAVAATGA